MSSISNQNIISFSKRFDAIRALRNLIDLKEQHRFTLPDLKEGGFLTLDGTLYLVQAIFDYEERNKQGKRTWSWKELELFGIESGEISYLEYEVDDGLVISLTDSVMKMREIGMTMKEIDLIADNEEGEILFNGTTYYYEDDYKAYFIKNGEEHEVTLYEFEAENGHCITIEAWGEESDEYEVFHSLPVEENSIVLIALGS